MNDDASYFVALVCEGPADARTIAALATTVAQEAFDWAPALGFCGLTRGDSFLPWASVQKINKTRTKPFRVQRFGEGPECRSARTATLLLNDTTPGVDLIVVVIDSDGQTSRATSLALASRQGAVVTGVAHCMREAWVLAGFEPGSKAEEALLQAEKQALGYDPRLDAHRLSAQDKSALRSPKRVLQKLTGGSTEREDECCAFALEVLEARGGQSGLGGFLMSLRDGLRRAIQNVNA